MQPKRITVRVNLLHAHGSPTHFLYGKGCKCALCRAAKAQYNATYRVSHRAEFAAKDQTHTRRAYQREWHRADRKKYPDRYRAYEKKKRDTHGERLRAASRSYYHRTYPAKREWLDDAEAFLGCCICGESQPHRLAWHHLTPVGVSGRRVATALHRQGIEGAIDEMKRCVLLCANCHKDVHHWMGDARHGL